jgi:hypothetical protein
MGIMLISFATIACKQEGTLVEGTLVADLQSRVLG